MHRGERFNSITHLVGTALAVVGTAVLVIQAARQGDPWKIVSFSVYGASLVLLYLSSTCYHSVRGRSKVFFQKVDHGAIYLLIAGSYTPFTLVTLRGPWGWSIFGVIWGLAVLGIMLDILHYRKGRRVAPVAVYIVMGWLVVVALRPLLRVLPMTGFAWLLAGGLLYTAGVVFYALDEKVPLGHGIFHLFVLAGSAAQYVVMYVNVL
jgi:hemolysin III